MVKKRKVEPTGKFKVVMIGREKFYLVKPKLFKKIMKTSAFQYKEKRRKKQIEMGRVEW